MICKIETTQSMDDLLADSRHYVSKCFLKEARSKGLNLIDENVVIFSHESMTTVAAPFVVDGKELNKNQSLFYLYFKGPTEADLEDGFYTIQGNLNKSGIDGKNLVMLNSEGKMVQQLELEPVEEVDGPNDSYNRNAIRVTDKHVKITKKGAVRGKISGTDQGRPFVIRWRIKAPKS